MKQAIITICLVLMVLSGQVLGATLNVPSDYPTIQAAINDANEGDTIIVSVGTYYENINFKGKNIVLTSTAPTNEDIVSTTIINGSDAGSVVIFSGTEDSNCVITGFTITNGRIYKPLYGGGIRGNGTTASITHCIIRGNTSEHHGGGLWNCNGLISDCNIISNSARLGGGLHICSGRVRNCFINANSAHSGGGLARCGKITDCIVTNNIAEAAGGGFIWCSEISDCIISGNTGGGIASCGKVNNCTISNNTGYYGVVSADSVNNCVIFGNSAYKGGGLSWCGSVNKCIIVGNTADFGGGIYCSDTNSVITNCTIVNNKADEDGGGIYCYGADASVQNSILWSNTAIRGNDMALVEFGICPIAGGECIFYPASMTVSDSDVQYGLQGVYVDVNCTLLWGDDNIDVDPYFADVNEGDYHLKSQAGRWDPNSESWVQDDITSPYIDAGNPASPIGYEPFPNGGIINIGAYGGTIEASKSYFGEPVCETIVAGDINGDCIVNFKDFALMTYHWLEEN